MQQPPRSRRTDERLSDPTRRSQCPPSRRSDHRSSTHHRCFVVRRKSIISTPRLHPLRDFHLAPINQLVSLGSSYLRTGRIILQRASRLDAFSGYPIEHSDSAMPRGVTADRPAVRPTRSSRTKVRPAQSSNAHSRLGPTVCYLKTTSVSALYQWRSPKATLHVAMQLGLYLVRGWLIVDRGWIAPFSIVYPLSSDPGV